jgi:cardiolipin synthase
MISIHFDFMSAGIITIFYLAGVSLALNAVFQSRTPQGTMAWFIALITIPFLSVPLFLLFGKKNLEDYDRYEQEVLEVRKKMEIGASQYRSAKDYSIQDVYFMKQNLSFYQGHSLKLLFDGHETFREMLETIMNARHYILLQMYIFRTDRIGTAFAEALIEKSRQGVKVYILYERLGIRMSKKTLRDMGQAGIALGEFSPIRFNKLQLNFRNHRKLLIVDGEFGFFGGINIGDDYLGRYPEIGHWRDTNVKVSGPIVGLSQTDFVKDWKFSQSHSFECNLRQVGERGQSDALLLNSGPGEERPLNLLQHIDLINSAINRLWVANPYIVPPQGIMDAFLIAVSRGVDVRIIVPERSDNRFVSFAMEIYLERLAKAGVRVYKYLRGMMHQKVILMDDKIAVIGSSNMDFRSMYINFENTIITHDKNILKELDLSFREDFDLSKEMNGLEFSEASFKHRLFCHLANSVAPIL